MPRRDGPPRIAVLPMRQFTPNAIPERISGGIIVDIISQLAALRELEAISYYSTLRFTDPAMDACETGRQLDACYLVSCSIHPAGDRHRLTTQVIKVETAIVSPPFQDDVDADLSLDLDRVVARVVNKVIAWVRDTEVRRIRRQRRRLLGVYEKLQLCRGYISQLNRLRFDEARRLLDDVIQEDPDHGEAYALAAEWHGAMIGENWSTDPAADIAAAQSLAQAALRHDSSNVRALVSCAHRRSNSYRDQTGAARIFQQALDLAPHSAIAWALSGLCFAYAGDGAEALRQAMRVLELSPDDREAYKFCHAVCVAYYTNEDYKLVAAWGKRALTNKVAWNGTRGFTAASLAALGRRHEARKIVGQMRARSSADRRVSAVMADLPYQDGRTRIRYGEHLAAAGYPE
jgi:adenylate cyclase